MSRESPGGAAAPPERTLRRLERALVAVSALLLLLALLAGAVHLTADALRH